MFERLTDRARKVMALANQEAQRFNHKYIGTEHVLLGIVREGSGVGAHVLKNLGVDFRSARLAVEQTMKPGPDSIPRGQLPKTPRTVRVVEYAIEEADQFGHNYVGSEHLLLGLLREHDGVAAQVLVKMGVSLDSARDEAMTLLGIEPPITVGDHLISALEGLLATLKSGKRLEDVYTVRGIEVHADSDVNAEGGG